MSEAQIDGCLADQADASRDDIPFCRDFGGASAIEEQLSCDDMPLFWGNDVVGGGS